MVVKFLYYCHFFPNGNSLKIHSGRGEIFSPFLRFLGILSHYKNCKKSIRDVFGIVSDGERNVGCFVFDSRGRSALRRTVRHSSINVR